MRHVIIAPYAFPEGPAGVNRAIAYSQGLIESGNQITFICLKPTENISKVINKQAQGVYRGISYVYPAGTTIRPPGIIKRFWYNYFGYFASIVYLIRLHKSTSIKSVLMLGYITFLKQLLLVLICKRYKISIVQEVGEYPFITSRPGIFFNLNLRLYLTIICRLLNGIVVISNALQQYYRQFSGKFTHLMVLPILVESARFSSSDTITDEEYIAYCGSMEGVKDDIHGLINAFAIIALKYPNLMLKIIGDTNIDTFGLIKTLVMQKGLESRIVFTGKVLHSQMPSLLFNAKALILTRISNKQNEGGFPTKLGEYLSTARPVIVSAVGEIPAYLKHLESAFLTIPGNASDVAEKIDLVFSDYSKAIQIGKKGQELALTAFDFRTQGKRLSDFLNSL